MGYKGIPSNNPRKIIECFIEDLKKFYDIGKYDIEKEIGIVEKMCNECDEETWRFCGKYNYVYEQFRLDLIGINWPFHRASLVGFQTENYPKWYLLDPTYGQFFENEKFRNYMKSHYKEFSKELLEKGYIECNLTNMFSYINGFIYSNAYIEEVNAKVVYEKLEVFLLSNYIVNKDLKSTEMKLIKILKK